MQCLKFAGNAFLVVKSCLKFHADIDNSISVKIIFTFYCQCTPRCASPETPETGTLQNGHQFVMSVHANARPLLGQNSYMGRRWWRGKIIPHRRTHSDKFSSTRNSLFTQWKREKSCHSVYYIHEAKTCQSQSHLNPKWHDADDISFSLHPEKLCC